LWAILERKKNHQKREKKEKKGKNNSTPKCTVLQFLDTQFQLSTVKLRDLEREREMVGGRERGLQICEQKGDGGWLNGGCILNKFVIKPAEFQGQAGARDLGEDR
jgi:hypothetical protein